MRGIKLKHGVTFVEVDGVTVRIKSDGACELSPIMLPSLEWDLRTEPPNSWDYVYDSDIKALGEDVLRQIGEIVANVRKITED